MNFTSSRGTKSCYTPASLRKELRHLSRELSSSDIPKVLSSRKSKAPSKDIDKENTGFSDHSLNDSEWVNGGGVVSPAVFSFSASSTPPKADFNVSEGAPLTATCSSAARKNTVENGSDRKTLSQPSNVWAPGSVIPRGLMVRHTRLMTFNS
jgi:hypothetical protein